MDNATQVVFMERKGIRNAYLEMEMGPKGLGWTGMIGEKWDFKETGMGLERRE